MAKDPEAKITVKMFNDDFKKGAKELTKESQTISREFKLQSEQMKLTATETEKLEAKIEFLTKKQDIAKKSVEENEKAYEQAKAMFGENSQAAEDMAKKLDNAKIEEQKLANELELTSRALKDQQTETGKTSTKFAEMGDKIEAVGEKVKAVGDGMKDAGKNLSVGVTAPIVGLGVAAISAFKEVDEGYDIMIKKTGATGEAAKELRKSFDNVAGSAPDTFSDIGTAIGEVNTQFGWLGPTLEKNADLMLTFATVTGQDVTSATINAKQAIEAYSMSNDDLESVLDSVAKTAQTTGQSTQDLFSKAISGAPQIKALGLSFGEGAEMIGRFEQAGVDSGAALTAMTKAQSIFAKEGKTLKDGLSETIDKIKNAKSETEALNVASTVFGAKGASKMVDAIKRGAVNFDDLAKAAEGAGGTVMDTFAETLDPLDQYTVAMNQSKLALASIGNEIQIAFLPLMNAAVDILGKVRVWFDQLSPGMKQTVVIIAAIAAAIGPLLVWVGMLVSSVGSIIGVFGKLLPILSNLGPAFTVVRTALAALTGPIGIIIAIVTVLAVIIYKNWDSIKEKTIEVFGYVKDFLSKTWENIKSITSAVFNFLIDFFKKWGVTILSIIGGPIVALVVAIIKNWDAIKDATTKIFEGIKTFLSSVWNSIKTTVTNVIVGLVTSAISTFTNMKTNISNVFESIKTIATNIFEGVKNAIVHPIETAKKTVLGIIDTIKDGFSKMKITIPKPKLPKVDISMGTKTIMGVDVPYPKFDISWFKTGGVFKKPVVAGNAGFGDVAEAIVPFEGSHAKRIAALIAEQQTKLSEVTNAIPQSQPIYIQVVSELDGQSLADNQYQYLNGMTTRDYNIGRTVKGY
ncbi:tail tape measure protein [Psychrobacillus phage Spoks]|nr:tail tape measure protein [Psychrobacillus phage Spoks]